MTLKLLTEIRELLKAADDDKELKELLEDYPNLEQLVQLINDYETEIAKELKKSKKEIIKALRAFIETGDDSLLSGLLPLIESDILGEDTIEDRMATISILLQTRAIEEITSLIMSEIDIETPFERLSLRTTKWIDSWSDDLGKLMKNTNAKAVSNALKKGLEEGEGIEDIIRRLEELPAFDRKRARATAVTEILTANSVSQQEAYSQSPCVEGKTWRHSGSKGINPRPTHVKLSGTTIPVEDEFEVGLSRGRYPRDTNLPAKERVFCHCLLQPSINKDILFLSPEDKRIMQTQALNKMDSEEL